MVRCFAMSQLHLIHRRGYAHSWADAATCIGLLAMDTHVHFCEAEGMLTDCSLCRCSAVVGTLYPAYASFKAIEYMRVHGDTDEASRWLMYWAIFGMWNVAEKILSKIGIVRWMPYYSPLKLAFLLWLQLPRFGGAYRLTSQFVRPFLHLYYPYIDQAVAWVCESFWVPEVAYIFDALQDVLIKVPGIEWFLRMPDGSFPPPSAPRSRIR
jgi:hypothetical protein